MDKPASEHEPRKGSQWGWWFFAAAALFYLLSEHRAHLFGVLPWLILLICPLMHFFMHGRHGGHRRHDKTRNEGEQP